MFVRLTIRHLAVISIVLWGIAMLSSFFSSDQVQKPPTLAPLTVTTPPTTPRPPSAQPRTVVWKERNPYTKFFMEAANEMIGDNEEWKVQDGCSDGIVKYVSIFLAVNTLTLTGAIVRYLVIGLLQANSQFSQPHVQRVFREISEIIKHAIIVKEL